jgi:hypothetical protein
MRRRTICFELCPSTYVQTGTFAGLAPVREVTARLEAEDIDLIDFTGLLRCQQNAFKHAF